ncbi:DNA repair protein rad16 [Entophlyctis sp. JEL0112]|nr:DNA repair protein rad16 [Entophlyctis sp. JEL0112]
MDKWSEDQLKRMRLGGNTNALEFFKAHPSWREKMPISEKYNSEFARWYKDKLSAECEGRSWVRPNPSTATPNQVQSAQLSHQSGQYSNSSSSSMNGNSSFRVNDAYFASKGVENQNRPSNLPPSQGGKYAGFGSTPAPSAQQSGDILADPLQTLSMGWSMFSSTLTKATQVAVSSAEVLGQTLTESVIKPTTTALRDPNNSLSSSINAFGQVVTENGAKGLGFVKGVVNAAATGENIGGFSGFSGFGDAGDEWDGLLQKAESLKKEEATRSAVKPQPSQGAHGGFGGFDKFEELRRNNTSPSQVEPQPSTSVSKGSAVEASSGNKPDTVAKKSDWDTDDTWEDVRNKEGFRHNGEALKLPALAMIGRRTRSASEAMAKGRGSSSSANAASLQSSTRRPKAAARKAAPESSASLSDSSENEPESPPSKRRHIAHPPAATTSGGRRLSLRDKRAHHKAALASDSDFEVLVEVDKNGGKASSPSDSDTDGSIFEGSSDSDDDSVSVAQSISGTDGEEIDEIEVNVSSQAATAEPTTINNDGGDNASIEAGEVVEEPVRRPRRPRAPRQTPEERALIAQEKLWSHHPELRTVWDELASLPRFIPENCVQPPDVTVKLLPFQLEGVQFLRKQEQGRFSGGILADEMGMGKTIQIIGLIASDKTVRPNLILTPTVAIMQWLAELRERVTPDFFKICIFHGTNRETSKEALESYDVVLSTYSIIESLFRKQQTGFKRKGSVVKEKSVLHSISWGRVILDEAHSIKDRSCSTARAVFNLNGRYKWSVTGTPLQNRVGELYSLIRFLDAEPFANYFCRSCPCRLKAWVFTNGRHCDSCGHISHQHFCWWNAEILKPIQAYGGAGNGRVAFDKLGALLDRIMLRRTKLERADDLGLPPRVIVVRRDVFNQAEEELYESLYTNSKRQFSTYVASNTVLNNYASIFSLLSRMRLAVNHPGNAPSLRNSSKHQPDLVTTKLRINANEANESLVCGICQDIAEDAVISKCKHVFCREDIREYILGDPSGEEACKCPVCFRALSIDLSQQTYEGSGKDREAVKTSIVNYIDMTKWRSSTKIEALVEELTNMQREDATTKSIVFSQFVAFLDIIHWRLSRAGFNCVKLDGRMTPQSRQSVINSFMTDPNVTIFLVSLKAGGVALNLTEASRVFILDPWWNPAVEDQAFDRIHRLGQHRPIKITRLIIENSIESRILQLQDKKKMLFQSTVGKDIDALAKLSEEDLEFLFVL